MAGARGNADLGPSSATDAERRELWALADPELNGYAGSAGRVGAGWPHLQQICRVERRRTVKGRVQVEVSAVTSLSPTVAGTVCCGYSGSIGTSKTGCIG